MRFRPTLAALAGIGTAFTIAVLSAPASAMGPVGPSAASKADNGIVEKVHRRWDRRRYRRHGYYPQARWYRTRPYYYSYDDPYYAAPYYYRPYYYPYYGNYYGPRYYGYGFYRPRFGVRIGF
ncbi:hypothetical protein [uncultured Hyphomicrobium sp.]|uniref:hypothetical protein n=1 Tax=uncultured Hyphomicrobium sp. TaxID=194373 RepID=UPI0025FF0A60|nr:hypothetical protein [uncultured Hyphomicrobium sp.]